MTDNEIMKALDYCCGNVKGEDDEGCNETMCYQVGLPEDRDGDTRWCRQWLIKDALDLINRKNKEIEKLSNCVVMQEKLLKENAKWMENKVKHIIADEKVKAEAIKEFVEKSENRLIELYEKYHKIANKPKKETDMFYQGRAEAIWECITTNRNLVKEMVGDAE